MYGTDLLDLLDAAVLDKTVDDLNEEVTELAASVGEVITA
jgi:hypothetical protein